MCLAVPAKIKAILPNDMLSVGQGRGSNTLTVSSLLLDETPKVGDFVIVHAGFALHKMDTTEAEEALKILTELANTEASANNSDADNYDEQLTENRF